MKTVRLASIALLSATLWISAAFGQQGKLKIDSIERLSARAAEVVDVTLDESLLQLAGKFLSSKRSPDEARAKDLINDLKGVYVKRFGFDREGEYTESDLEPIRAQLRAPGWSRIVAVRSTRDIKNIEVFINFDGNVIKGISVVAAEPRELTVVNVIGPIDIDKLSAFEGQFGIPRLGLERTDRGKQ
ncbi:MAG TPA: DUF4252 domain-containing protein [Acidobacteriota bacterium]